MTSQNGDKNEILITIENNTPSLFSHNTTVNNGIKIEDIIDNDDLLNDLRTNPNSKYKEILTSKNINILIHYSLQPKAKEKKENELQKELRYAYYSCQILCSHCVLNFSKSIKYISKSNIKEEEKNKSQNNNIQNSVSKDKENDNNSYHNEEFIYQNPLNEDPFDQMNSNDNPELENEEYFHFEYNNEIEEKFKEITETEIKKTSINKKPITEYDANDKKIINDILDEIFKMLDCIKKEDFTYIGYFQKIINYMIFIESDIIFKYLFKEKNKMLNSLYKHLDKLAIQNIFENILNKLLDESYNEDISNIETQIVDENNQNNKNIKNNQNNKNDKHISYVNIYYNIIQRLLEELTKDYNYEKNEIICDLIINTLLNNNEKMLIYLIFECENNTNMIQKIYKYIVQLINENNKNNEKLIINILQMLCQLNNIIMKSFYKSSYFSKNNYINLFIEDYKKINTFEYQYIPKKTIYNEILFEAYQKNINLYLKMINDIYILIKEDIIKKEKQKMKNNNISSENNNNQIIDNNKKIFGYFHLYEWKFILNALKIYIYSFYAIKKNTIINKDYFNFKDLFPISIQFYFDYSQNNIYQNIFTEIIRLMSEESCPKYINKFLLKNDNEENKFIFKIINNLKTEINNKYYLSIGSNIEILKIIYSSFNQKILKYFRKSKLDNKIKDIFIQSINPNLERKLLDDYEYSFSEIFNSENELNDTFDGNDIDIDRNYPCLKQLIEKFLKKYEEEKKDFIINNNKKEEIKKYEKKFDINLMTNIIKEKVIINYEKESFEIKRGIEMKLKEENQINNNLSDTSNSN